MTEPYRIPADVDREDRIVAGLTARQVAILAVTGIVLYAAWTLTREVIPLAVFLIPAIPIAATAAILALGQRDGVPLDRLVLAAIRQRLGPRHRVAAPEGIRPAPEWLTTHANRDALHDTAPTNTAALDLPAAGVHAGAVADTGVVDLGSDGLAVVAVVSTVNFALRTPAEQEGLVASFGRYLHSLTAPVQVLVRAERLDVSAQIAELREQAGGLPHLALEQAALEHADYLVQLGEHTDLLRRQVLLILREGLRPAGDAAAVGGSSAFAPLVPGRGRKTTQQKRGDSAARRAAESRLVRRLGEAVELLAPAGIVVTPLDAGQATAVLASSCNPDTVLPPTPGLAGADDIITTPSGGQPDPGYSGWASDAEGAPADYDAPADAGFADDWDYDTEDDEDDFAERGRVA